MNFSFLLMLSLRCCSLLLNLLENFRLVFLMKDWLIKKRVNYNLNADQSSFLANKNLRHALELYVKNNIIQNNLYPKPNYKIVY